MAFFDSRHQRAAIVLALLAIGLTVALAPYATGLIAVPVLYVVLAPLHRWLCRWLKPGVAAGTVIVLTILVIVLPGISILSLIVGQAQNIAGTVMTGPLLDRLQALQIGPFDVGREIVRLGQTLVSWLGGNALALLGTVTRLSINVLLALFGLYYLLLNPDGVWHAVRPYIPFSPRNTDVLRDRFVAIAISTVIGTGLTAAAQGVSMALGFTFTGLGDPLFWGVVTVVFAVLPVVGSGMIWVPGVAVLVVSGRPGAAAFLVGWSLLTTAIIDYIFRPLVFNRFAQVHPLITLVGAIAGVSYFGLLGLLVGPLALSYFFEILRMYRQEFVPAGTQSGFTEEMPLIIHPDEPSAPPAS
ncbi:MAG: AI-2E family transporter [Gemmatimonadetes bacterium]|nr:AI-2E family transporter [Gemmatimonadota bacterium]MCC7133377.1 AI-2E family transporter [Gemmatimonadales bacterium]